VALPEPATAAGRAGLAAVLADPARALVAVDYDGTLAPIVPRPEDARPAAGAQEALAALAQRIGTVAVVSGRAASDVVALGALDGIDRLVVLGHYGLERWAAGAVQAPPVDPAVDAARAELPALLGAAPAGVHVEDKRHSVVVHTRPADDPAGALAAIDPPLRALAGRLGLEVVEGRYVLELRPPGVDKGSAVDELAGSAGAAAVVYVGDDLGDLPVFAAIDAGRRAGRPGLAVASADPAAADAPAEVVSAADLVLDGPPAVVAFLAALAAAVGEP
jgi:trehalose 6-phosphate phosphatase